MLVAAALTVRLAAMQPAAAADDARTKAAQGAAFLFGQACLLRLNVAQTPAAYAAGSDELGRGVIADTPALKGVLVIDGAAGLGCRVSYTGDQADTAWRSLSAAYATMTTGAGACTSPVSGPDRLTAVCTSEAAEGDPKSVTRRADLTISRSGASVSASLARPRP